MWSHLHVYKFPVADSWSVKNVLGVGKQAWTQEISKEATKVIQVGKMVAWTWRSGSRWGDVRCLLEVELRTCWQISCKKGWQEVPKTPTYLAWLSVYGLIYTDGKIRETSRFARSLNEFVENPTLLHNVYNSFETHFPTGSRDLSASSTETCWSRFCLGISHLLTWDLTPWRCPLSLTKYIEEMPLS